MDRILSYGKLGVLCIIKPPILKQLVVERNRLKKQKNKSNKPNPISKHVFIKWNQKLGWEKNQTEPDPTEPKPIKSNQKIYI